VTIVLLGLGALASAVGTRAALLLFVGAAVAGAMDDFFPALSVWTASMLAGLLLRPGLAARRLALPALGAGAVLVAASSSNAAAVVGLWVVGTAVVCFGRGQATESRRWALLVCLADIPLAGAVIYNAVDSGFEAWPPVSGSAAAIAMLVSAGLRLPLTAGSDDENEETALVVVRTQTAALILVGLSSGGLGLAEGVVGVAAAAFLMAGLAGSPARRDGAQELSLVALAAAGSVLGWTPEGWVWGALAAGTLIHHLRVSSEDARPNVLVAGVLNGAGFGLPFLPVVAALLEGSLRAGSWYGAVTAIACLLGLALRARPEAEEDAATKRRKGRDLAGILRFSWLALTVLAGLAAFVLALPRPPAGDVLSWPPLWAAAVIGACGLVGARFPRFAPRSQGRPGGPAVAIQAWRPVPRAVSVLERVAQTRALEASLVLLVLTGIVLWAAGILRGFL
jgi:hypothetical protein